MTIDQGGKRVKNSFVKAQNYDKVVFRFPPSPKDCHFGYKSEQIFVQIHSKNNTLLGLMEYYNKKNQEIPRYQMPNEGLHSSFLDRTITSSQPSTELYTSRSMLIQDYGQLHNIVQQQRYQQTLLYGPGLLTLISISFSTGCLHMGHLFD
jgi:hypothetical protein